MHYNKNDEIASHLNFDDFFNLVIISQLVCSGTIYTDSAHSSLNKAWHYEGFSKQLPTVSFGCTIFMIKIKHSWYCISIKVINRIMQDIKYDLNISNEINAWIFIYALEVSCGNITGYLVGRVLRYIYYCEWVNTHLSLYAFGSIDLNWLVLTTEHCPFCNWTNHQNIHTHSILSYSLILDPFALSLVELSSHSVYSVSRIYPPSHCHPLTSHLRIQS